MIHWQSNTSVRTQRVGHRVGRLLKWRMLKLEKVTQWEIDTLKKLNFHTNVAVWTEEFQRHEQDSLIGRHFIKWRIRRSTKVKCKIFHNTGIGCPYLYLENKITVLGGVIDEIYDHYMSWRPLSLQMADVNIEESQK